MSEDLTQVNSKESSDESKYAASARAFRDNVSRDLANDELRANFRGAMDYLIAKRKDAFYQ